MMPRSAAALRRQFLKMSRCKKGIINPELHRFDRRVIIVSDRRKQPAPDGRKRMKACKNNVGKLSVTQPD
ncbi:hypothetical protein LINGRAHAP2_LOCUS10275 [Linum grandiflorum]